MWLSRLSIQTCLCEDAGLIPGLCSVDFRSCITVSCIVGEMWLESGVAMAVVQASAAALI